jgi:hypothetical protein
MVVYLLMDFLERRCLMARPRKIKHSIFVKIQRNVFGRSINWLANKYKVSKRTIWRYLK